MPSKSKIEIAIGIKSETIFDSDFDLDFDKMVSGGNIALEILYFSDILISLFDFWSKDISGVFPHAFHIRSSAPQIGAHGKNKIFG